MNKIDKVLLDKCICIYPIIFKFYYLSILDICSTNYLKQWSTVYFINETFDISNINKDSVLTKLPIDSKYNKKNSEYKKIPQLKELRFDNFVKNYYKELPIISSEEALKFI
jgi:hypothetical protein